MESTSKPVVNIARGFLFRVYIEEAKNKEYVAVLRKHNSKFGIVTAVRSDGYALWSEKQTLSLLRGTYDLEVWDSKDQNVEGIGHKLFVQEKFGRVIETYASMNNKTATDITLSIK